MLENQTADQTALNDNTPDQEQTSSATPTSQAAAPSQTASSNQPASQTATAQQRQPSQPQGYEPHNVWGAVFKALGGGDRTEYHVAGPNETDAQGKPIPEGTTVGTKVAPSKGDLGKAILASVIYGLAAGEKERGPGAGLRSFAAGAGGTLSQRSAQDDKARAQAQTDFAQKQAAQLKAAQIFSANAEAIHNIRLAEQIQDTTFQGMIDRDSAALADVDEADIIAKDVPQDQALADLKAGKYGATKHNVYATGSTEVRDKDGNVVTDPMTGQPKREVTVTITNDGQVPISKEDAARYAQYGIPGFRGLAPSDNTTVSASQKRGWDQMVHSIENARGLAKKMGVSDEEFSKALQEPGAAKAFQMFSRYSTGDPYADLLKMEAAKDKDSGTPTFGPRTMGLLRDAFGGDKAMQYHNQLAGQASAVHAELEEQARQKAKMDNPTSLQEAAAAQARAETNYKKNPSKDNQAQLKIAQGRVRTFQSAEASARYQESYAAQSAQFAALDTQLQKNWPDLIEGIKNYQVDPEKLSSLRGNQRQQFMAQVMKEIPGWSEADYKAKFSTVQDFRPGGKQGQAIVSLNTFAGHANDANNAIQYLRNTDARLLNAPINKISGALAGNPALVNFQTDLMMARDEAMNFIKSGHAVLKEEQEALDGIVNPNSTPAEMQQFLKTLSGLALVRANSINSAYEYQMGKPIGNLFNPQSQQALRNLGHGAELDRLLNGGRTTPVTQSHVFSVSAWQKANPKGDVNAAKAAAQAQGYQVTQ